MLPVYVQIGELFPDDANDIQNIITNYQHIYQSLLNDIYTQRKFKERSSEKQRIIQNSVDWADAIIQLKLLTVFDRNSTNS